ncbi:hypothetical protein D3C75_1012180 [compost metagenome]
MPRADDMALLRGGAQCRANGGDAVLGGHPGGDAFRRLDGDGEAGAVAGLVVLHHGCQLQFVDGGLVQAQADDAAAIANHHGHGLQRDVLGGGDDVRFVLAVVVVEQQHRAPGLEGGDGGGKVGELLLQHR